MTWHYGNIIIIGAHKNFVNVVRAACVFSHAAHLSCCCKAGQRAGALVMFIIIYAVYSHVHFKEVIVLNVLREKHAANDFMYCYIYISVKGGGGGVDGDND